MARQSADARLVALPGGLGKRPDPPEYLSDAQAKIWREIAASESVTFFDTAALRALLCDYCRHTATSAELSQQIERYDLASLMVAETAALLDRLTKMRDRETKAAGDKATKLRLTNQSRYTPKAAATASKNQSSNLKKPWD
jgi:hypothetical protein